MDFEILQGFCSGGVARRFGFAFVLYKDSRWRLKNALISLGNKVTMKKSDQKERIASAKPVAKPIAVNSDMQSATPMRKEGVPISPKTRGTGDCRCRHSLVLELDEMATFAITGYLHYRLDTLFCRNNNDLLWCFCN